MARFETKNEDFFQKIINNLDSESTQRTISSSVKLFNEFLIQNNVFASSIDCNIDDLNNCELDKYLRIFFGSIKKGT